MDIKYIAGFFDGEGTCGVYINGKQGSYNPKVSFYQNEKEVLEEIKNYFGIGKIFSGGSRGKGSVLSVQNRRHCSVILQEMLPFLRVKYKDALKVIEWCENTPYKREGGDYFGVVRTA